MIRTRPVLVLPNKRRYEWLIPIKGAVFAGTRQYTTERAAMRAGYAAWERLKQQLTQGDMP